MAGYNMVKFCRLCKVRFVVPKELSKKFYCDACEKKVKIEREKEQEQEE